MLPGYFATIRESLSRKLSFQSDKEQEVLLVDQQDLGNGNDELKVLWFSEIPRCAFGCLYPPALECGCASSDFSCICASLPAIAEDEDARNCYDSCPENPDHRWTPSRIVDFCELVGEHIQLPEYMNQFAGLHRRAGITLGTTTSTTSSIFATSYSDAGSSNSGPETTVVYVTSTADPESSSTPTSTASTSTTTHAQATSLADSTSEANGVPKATSSIATATGTSPAVTATGSASSGLSTGAKAGIGVAVPLALIILGLILFWYFRKRKANKQQGVSGIGRSNNTAEADSNALYELGGNSASKRANDLQSPEVYELSSTPSFKRPLPAVSVRDEQRQSQGQKPFNAHPAANARGSRKPVTPSTMSASSKLGDLENSLGTSVTAGTLSQSLEGNTREDKVHPVSGMENSDQHLSQLEAEMAHIAEERERLQHLQSLAQREAELKKQIAARKLAISRGEVPT